MSNEELQQLFDKYYQGDTSLEEERKILDHVNDVTRQEKPDGAQVQFLYFKSKRNESPSPGFTDRVEQLFASRSSTTSHNLRQYLRIAAVAIIIFGAAWFFLTIDRSDSIKTSAGQQLSETLPDGSVVWLNEKSEIILDESFNVKNRSVSLRGEAYMEIQTNPSKPFIVHTGKVTTEVVGTSFNIRSYGDEQVVELDVANGKVKFGTGTPVEVIEGQRALFNLSQNSVKTTVRNLNADSWKTKRLVFEDVLMNDVLHDLEKFFNIEIQVETPLLLNCHFRGHFFNPELNDVLKVLAYSLNVEYTKKNGAYILSGQGCELK